jgi:hypothetical protein
MPKQETPEAQPDVLKGWQQIAAFLGQPVSVVQRWVTEGMPVKREGRYVESSRPELNRWLGRESAGEPVQIATPETDLSAELKRGLTFVRKHSRAKRKKAAYLQLTNSIGTNLSSSKIVLAISDFFPNPGPAYDNAERNIQLRFEG